MLRKIREAQKNEEGFTLIELLVVVIIIGILAAIAIPAFLSQRERAYQAELTSGVRNAALEVEAAVTNAGAYPDDAAGQTIVDGFEDAGTLTLTYDYTAADTNAGTPEMFEICGTHSQIGGAHSLSYDSTAGGLQDYDDTNGC